jgi:molybdenum cofactor biosynthesis enzyme MoaA
MNLPKFENLPPDFVSPDDKEIVMPGRKDLRISLTSACNLKCAHCHNEGQVAPWLAENKALVTLDQIAELLEVASKYGVRSVKFTGGDPGVYRDFYGLMSAIANWRVRYPDIDQWSIATNGTPFLNPKKFKALVESKLTNISIGIDSVEPGELSKPSSSVGVEGTTLIQRFVTPLVQAWKGRHIKFDAVFTGDELRVRNVVRAGRGLGIDISVIEINDVMESSYDVRDGFLQLIGRVADEYGLEPRLYEPLNEICLYDSKGDVPIRFYQDHCQDRDCGNCRKVHLRVSPTADGWGAVPCFLQAQSRTIPLMVDGRLSASRFEDAIRYNGRGPNWFANTPYEDRTTPSKIDRSR